MTREQLVMRLDVAIKAYRAAPDCKRATELRRAVHGWLTTNLDLPSVGPSLGVLDALDELHPRREIKWLLYKLAVWWLKTFVLRPDCAGWNDYWMARWEVTGSSAAADELHRRNCHLVEWPDVVRTARWMVHSVRSEDPDFDAAMCSAAARCSDCNPANGAPRGAGSRGPVLGSSLPERVAPGSFLCRLRQRKTGWGIQQGLSRNRLR